MAATIAKTTQTVEVYGNGLGIRITASMAKAANLVKGTQVTVELDGGAIVVRSVGQPKLHLSDRLKHFDPALHGGEAMASDRVGAEVS